MERSFFVFNDINSIDMGIIVNKLPPISKAERNFEEIEVPGRNGKLFIDNKCYKSFTYQIECTLLPGVDIRKISTWLNGLGKLTTSREKDKYYDVIIRNQIDFVQVYRIFNEFVIEFEVQPISHSLETKEITLTKESDFYIEQSTYEIKPYVRLYGNGNITLTINNRNVILSNIDNYIELDCELEEAYKDNENCNSKIECDEFPEFSVGKNHVSWVGTVSKVIIRYEEAFL